MNRYLSRAMLAAGTAGAFSLGWLGCEAPTGSEHPNQAPSTFLSISGADVDTTFYAFDLSWWGADSDGEVDRYEFQWDSFWSPAPTDTVVDGWVQTTLTARRFIVQVMGVRAAPTFTVRAIDNDDAVDPTPPTQTFHVANVRPTASFADSIPRPSRSLPAVTFSVNATDADGPETLIGYYVWFDGTDYSVDRRFFPGVGYTEFTIGPDMFPGSGEVTLNIVSVDETGTTSVDTLRHTWEAVDVSDGRVLLVDHHPESAPNGAEIDAFFADNLAAVVDPSEVVTLSYTRDGGFRSRDEIDLLLGEFEGLVWYGGQAISVVDTRRRATELEVAVPAIEAFVEGGGRVLVQATYAFGDLRSVSDGGGPRDWDAAWDSLATHEFLGRAAFEENPQSNSNFTLFLVSLEAETPSGVETLGSGVMNSVDFFGPLPNGSPVVWVPPGSIQIGLDSMGQPLFNPVNFVCGMSVPIELGHFIGLTFPIARAGGPGSAANVAQSLFRTLYSDPAPRPGPLSPR